jgi:hypothetical protein
MVSEASSEAPLTFDSIKNARDLSSADESFIRPNKLYRTGMLSNASPEDAVKITSGLSLKTLVDLRSLTELKTDDGLNTNPVFDDFTDIKWSSVRSAREVKSKEKYDGKSEASANRKERHFVSLMDEKKYVVGTFQRIQKRKIAKLAVTAPTTVVSRRMRSKAKKVFLDAINGGGLPMMNELILQMAAKVCMRSSISPPLHPPTNQPPPVVASLLML